MLAVPLVSLVALWGFAASITISPALKDANYTANTKTTNAGVYPLSARCRRNGRKPTCTC